MIKKRVLVTGANGYIGRHVVKELLDNNFEVYAADFRFDGLDSRAHQVTTEIFSGSETIYDELGRPDICIHLAWRNGFVHNSESHIVDLPNHYIFLKHMIEGGLPQLIVMGSMHEVGYWEGAIDENTPTKPMSLYAIAKNSLREMIDIFVKQHNTIFQWTRGFYIIGDDLRSNSIFSKIVQAEKEGKDKFPFTTGKNLYDFITVDGLAKQIVAVASQTEVDGIINCCTGNPVSLADEVESFIKQNGFKIKLEYGVYPEREYDSPGIWGDPTKINCIMKMNQKVVDC